MLMHINVCMHFSPVTSFSIYGMLMSASSLEPAFDSGTLCVCVCTCICVCVFNAHFKLGLHLDLCAAYVSDFMQRLRMSAAVCGWFGCLALQGLCIYLCVCVCVCV
ncbi:hypothetical protein CHARACLAT_003712 [Characodon lateralis]|uniref:Uncharacterized protein n=1 Tax=Characodon lateralis TaxID=208331 RepID=A0ABU7F009_9TELE|nr:hypothetical protein [Characodon lateralis]